MAEMVLSTHTSLTPEIPGSAGQRAQEVIFSSKKVSS